ncbi:hypothetical protein EJD97_018193 [Solanum chilense]|uniref:Acyl-coenzyme A oxidase n=1 Tax=Solanum chilense TaxID=4083 RepID=A0A6N2B475_SOLCI|nr:hypothetical protein EJD97_018193 [Solanum chilense]
MEGIDYLAEERKKAEFNVDEMKIVWAGSRRAFEVSDYISKLVADDPDLSLIFIECHRGIQDFSKEERTMLSRKELFKDTLRNCCSSGTGFLHKGVFIPAIKGQGNKEQLKKWLPLAYKMQIIGCYAQTELGHGSNVQGLETTATFDPQTDEFVIHSPTLTSSKWWPGGLGKVSTHAIVYARLITDGKDHGINGFIVQLRSLEDHKPLPGITVGDIGTKFGNGAYNTMDNGVLRFDHVRIPRDQMLMRVAQVTKDGKYVQSDVPRQLLYVSMVHVRQALVTYASGALSRAVCIATRYSAVRRQFGSQNGGQEIQVIDYKTQQSRLKANDFSTLPELHATTAGIKSLTTTATADGIEECRKLCGGHGYLCSSGLPELYAVSVPACTFEGDNVVLLLQVARFLMKTLSQLSSGKKPTGTIAYMGKIEHLMQCHSDVEQAKDWLKPSAILEAFEARAARMSVSCAQSLSKFDYPEEGFQELATDLVEAAVAHCQLIVVSKFIEKLQQDIPGEGVKQQLVVLCSIYALFLLHKHQGDFLATGYITSKQGLFANEQLRALYTQVRPNVVSLVDAFNHTDHFLGSILGRYDGNVYPKLYEAAWNDPLNESDIPDGFHEYIRPLLEQKLQTARL